MYYLAKKHEEVPDLPVYNMRHVHPIRQSGPIPPYYGDWNMEDVKKANHGLFAGDEPYPAHTDVDELMRRVVNC